jgi:hypothetical protein
LYGEGGRDGDPETDSLAPESDERIGTKDKLQKLLTKVFKNMPPHFRKGPKLSEYNLDFGFNVDDILKIGKIHFLKHYLGINVI